MQDGDSETAAAQDSSDQQLETAPQPPNGSSSAVPVPEAAPTTIPPTPTAREEDSQSSTIPNTTTDIINISNNNNSMSMTTIDLINQRAGTTASARFNILSTMVGGGSLSLPLAFQLTGNALLGPILLIVVAAITEFCFRTLVASARTLSPVSPNQTEPGKDSFESIAYAAFGTKAYLLSTALVVAMCFFGIVGYAVLLRDMLQPISDVVFHATISGPTAANNATMFAVVLLVTPLCTLKTLTALKRFGAASMVSVFILGCCVLYRSLECNLGLLFGEHADTYNWRKTFQLWPHSWKQVLDAFPLYVSCFVCHYNILTVHNELRHPTLPRVGWWLRSTTWIACAFYMMIGVAGSAYGACTPTGKVHGNVLLDFSDSDPLLLVGRMCLALTITLAFPMLTIPARDIIIRSLPSSMTTCLSRRNRRESSNSPIAIEESTEETLQEPLLSNDDEEEPTQSTSVGAEDSNNNNNSTEPLSVMAPLWLRLVTAIFFFWSAALVASCVASIDIVWDLLGSSLSILLSHLIPCGSYLVIQRQQQRDESSVSSRVSWKKRLSVRVSWLLLVVFVPLMVASTANAVYNTFFA